MSEMNCIIVEDEPLAARVLENYIGQTPGLALVATCEDALTAMEVLNTNNVELIFLDINLPKINGLNFIKTLKKKYHIVLTTAYHQYAIEGFELDVMDYLLKPITFERFLKTVNKTREYNLLLNKPKDAEALDYFFVKSDNKLEKINYHEILFIESLANYVIIQTNAKKIITYSTLKNVEEYLPSSHFIKIQKSFIVALDKIDRIEGGDVVIGGKHISISRHNKEEVMEAILRKKLLKR